MRVLCMLLGFIVGIAGICLAMYGGFYFGIYLGIIGILEQLRAENMDNAIVAISIIRIILCELLAFPGAAVMILGFFLFGVGAAGR